MTTTAWTPFEGTTEEILERYPRPLEALAGGEVPAFVLRGIYPADHCRALMERFGERSLLYDPHVVSDGEARRVDIGTSFGHHRRDRDAFFAHSQQTHELFSTLFDGYCDPVRTMYEALAELAPDKRVMTAQEPDGRRYGPAIFRIYHAQLGHKPHYDSVARRTKAFDYAVSRFEQQFAGVLCFQNSAAVGDTGEPFLYNCPGSPELQPALLSDFQNHVAENGIERAQVHLEPGDLYFFFSENVHEVPPVVGDRPRAVLAIFFATSADEDEISLPLSINLAGEMLSWRWENGSARAKLSCGWRRST